MWEQVKLLSENFQTLFLSLAYLFRVPINTCIKPLLVISSCFFLHNKSSQLIAIIFFRKMLGHIVDVITCCGDDHDDNNGNKKLKCERIKGTVVLMKKNVLDFNDFHASFLDRFHELLGRKVTLQLISAVHGEPAGEWVLFLIAFFFPPPSFWVCFGISDFWLCFGRSVF